MSSQKVTKAVLPVAGYGTRFLPATKATPKEMLPIIDKPLVQYAVEEAALIGIKEIIFITSHTKESIQKHFSRALELENKLIASNKNEYLEKVNPSLLRDLTYKFINQEEQLGLGHAISLAKNEIKEEPFAVLLPDDLFISEPSCLKQLLDIYNEYQKSVVAVNKIDIANIHKYGVISSGDNASPYKINSIIEKPSAKEAPSDIAVCGRYILSSDIFEHLENVKKDDSGEIQLTDAIQSLLQKEDVMACLYEGEKYDCGSKKGYIEATIKLALDDDSIKKDINSFIRDLVE